MSKILFLIPDIPGFYPQLSFLLAEKLKASNYEPVFALASYYPERLKEMNFNKLGEVYYLNEFLKKDIPAEEYKDIAVNHWSYYPTYVMQSYFFGKHQNDLSTYQKAHLFFSKIYDEHPSIKLLHSEGVSNSFLYIAYLEGQKRNISYFGYMISRAPQHFSIHLTPDGLSVLENTSNDKSDVQFHHTPDYMKNSRFGAAFQKDKNNSLWQKISNFIVYKNSNGIDRKNSKKMTYKAYRKFLKRMLLEKYFHAIKIFAPKVDFAPSGKYVLFPIHYRPEASTSVLARYYENDYEIIKNIAFSLPHNTFLVVKEHRSNIGNNTQSFYKRIKRLPNTILLSPEYPLKANIDKFDSVITLSSTVGYEALQKSVPVGVLGDVFYQNYPGSTIIDSPQALFEYIQGIQKNEPKDNPEINKLYLKMCFPGNTNYMDSKSLDIENIQLLAKPMESFLAGEYKVLDLAKPFKNTEKINLE